MGPPPPAEGVSIGRGCLPEQRPAGSVAFDLEGTRCLPAWTDKPLSLVAPAAISALVATMVLTDHGTPRIPGLPETCALAATFVVVRRTGNVAAGMLCGFPVL